MPRYDYRCSACGSVYEKREGFDAPSVQECPSCRGQARRVLTPPAIVFKGSGWYVNDSRKSSSSDSAAAPAAPAAASAESTSTTSTPAESKPADSKPSTAASKAAAAD